MAVRTAWLSGPDAGRPPIRVLYPGWAGPASPSSTGPRRGRAEPATAVGAGCARPLRSAGHVLQVEQQGAQGVLGVVDAQDAVLRRGEEAADQARAVPVGEVLRRRLGVLQGG